MWDDELRCPIPRNPGPWKLPKQAAEGSFTEGVLLLFVMPWCSQRVCVLSRQQGETPLPVRGGTEVSITKVQNSPLDFSRIWPVPPWRAASLSPIAPSLFSQLQTSLCIFPRYASQVPLQPGPLVLPKYLHCSLGLHLLHSPSRSLPLQGSALTLLPPISRFPEWKRPVDAAISLPARLPGLPYQGFCRRLPGSPPTSPLLWPGLLLSSVVPWFPGSLSNAPSLSPVSLICLLIWGIKSLLFGEGNSLVLRRAH